MKYTEHLKNELTMRDALTLHRIKRGADEAGQLCDDQISSVSVSQILEKLRQKGFIERHPHPEDRRKNVYTITATGRELAE